MTVDFQDNGCGQAKTETDSGGPKTWRAEKKRKGKKKSDREIEASDTRKRDMQNSILASNLI